MPPDTIVFAGGGTGGHLFPALAIADALTRADPRTAPRFICSDRPIDTRILTAARTIHAPVRARPFSLRPRKILQLGASWGAAVRQSRALIAGRTEGWDRARALIALGGFVAAPPTQAARAERTPIVLVNLDAVPGKANRWIARHASLTLTAATGAHVPGHWTRIPPIVRPEARATRSPADARTSLDLDPDLRTLLITGGSQGARSINEFLAAFAAHHADALQGWQILHQAGRDETPAVAHAYEAAGVPARVVEFIDRVGDAWAAADLAVARSGAGTVAEVWANKVPTLFLPYPFHRDEHQRHNAAPLIEAGGAAIATDAVEPALNLDRNADALRRLLEDHAARATMTTALERLGPADGERAVAAAVSDLLRAHPR